MDILSSLNPQQRQAVTARPGPTLVLAGPGSGKTRVLTYRIAYLVGELHAAPHTIMAVTFTNKAAKEMKLRVEKLLDGHLRGLTIGTFHSTCARLLRREAAVLPVTRDFVIFDTSDQEALIKQTLRDLNIDEKKFKPGTLLAKISAAKNELITPDEFAAGTYFAEVTKRVYAHYQGLLVANNALDFDDLLMDAVQLFHDHPDVLTRYQQFYEHILVDEFQDTNTVQYALLGQLAERSRNLYAVGDPDQSIYRWRGADYRNVRRFQKDYPDAQTILLEQNYRSTQVILDAAMAVIDKHPGRTRKQLFTERQGGVEILMHEAYNEEEEAQFVLDALQDLVKRRQAAPGDCAIMYRTNAQSRAVEEAFIRANQPYKLVGAQRFYGRKEVKDVLGYLRLIHNPADTVSLNRVINVPPRGLGAKTLDTLAVTAEGLDRPVIDILRDLGARGPQSAYASAFGGKAAAGLANFGKLLAGWQAQKQTLTVVQLLDDVLERSGYQTYIQDDTEEGDERWANVLELRGVAAEYQEADLATFLEQVALVSDQDTLAGDEEGKPPTLLTLHAAKGLEFPVVFILGLDDGVLPHQRSFEDSEAMLEERRLFYVGMTRAKDRLYLLRAFRRSLYGDSSLSIPSRFLKDIPGHLLQEAKKTTAAPKPKSFGQRRRAAYADDEAEDTGARSKARPSERPSSYSRVISWDTPARPPTLAQYRSGQRVRHAQFGEGIVVEAKLSGGEEEVIVAFDEVGIKRLLASLAKLEVLKG
jgi:DNA helicase II / ATP-dependent DNA helicase PcrA